MCLDEPIDEIEEKPVVTEEKDVNEVMCTFIFLKRLKQAKLINHRFLISDMHVQNKKYGNFVSISRLTCKCTAQK